MIELARAFGVSRISFLSADVFSDSFGRETRGYVETNENILLDQDEVSEFRKIIEDTIKKFKNDFDSKFISESPEKMQRILQYYGACIGINEYPRNTCNAPMVSAVIDSIGTILPCYFLPSIGNIRKNSIGELLNNSTIKNIRKKVRDYTLERCKQCVCTLYVDPRTALMNRF
jgi:MoaA/NifB/PqqE/SkfB family radical SAM enzyme